MKNKIFKIIASVFLLFSFSITLPTLLVSCSKQEQSTTLNNNGIFGNKNKLQLIDYNKSAKYNLNYVLNSKNNILNFLELNKNIIFENLVNKIIFCNAFIDQSSLDNSKYSTLIIHFVLDNNKEFKIKIIDLAIITKPSNNQFMDYFFSKINQKRIIINDSFNKITSQELVNIINNNQNIEQIINQCIENINTDNTNAYLFNKIYVNELDLSLNNTTNHREKILKGKINNALLINSAPILSNILVIQNNNLPTIDFLKKSFNAYDNLKDLTFNDSIKINMNNLENLNKTFLIENSNILFGLNILPNIINYKIEMFDYFTDQNYIKISVKFENEPEISCKLINFKKCEKITNIEYLNMFNNRIYQDIQFINTFEYSLEQITSDDLSSFINKDNLIIKAIELVNSNINNSNNNYYVLDVHPNEISFGYKLDDGYTKLTIDINSQYIIKTNKEYISSIKIFTKPVINDNVILNEAIKEIFPLLVNNKTNLISPPINQVNVDDCTLKIDANFNNSQPLIFNNFNDLYNDLYSKYKKIINSTEQNINGQIMFENDLNAWMNAINNNVSAEIHTLIKKENNYIAQRTYNKIQNLTNINFNSNNNLLSFNFELIGINEIIDENNNIYCQLYTKNSYIIKDANIIPILTNDPSNKKSFYSSWMINKINKLNSTINDYEISFEDNNLINNSIFKTDINNEISLWRLNIETMNKNLNKTQTKSINIDLVNYNRTINYSYQNLEKNCYSNSFIKFINFKNPDFCGTLYSPYINSYYELVNNKE